MSRLLNSVSTYSRIQDSNGNPLNSTDGKLNVIIEGSIVSSDVKVINPISDPVNSNIVNTELPVVNKTGEDLDVSVVNTELPVVNKTGEDLDVSVVNTELPVVNKTGEDLDVNITNTSIPVTTNLDNTVNTPGTAVSTQGLMMIGSDGTNAQRLKTDTDGTLYVSGINFGNLDVAIQEPLTAFGELKVAESTPTVQLSFVYGIPTDLIVKEIVGSGTITGTTTTTPTDSLALISTGSPTADSKAILYSKRYVKYRTGTGCNFRGTAIFDNPVANNEQLIGVGDDKNGLFFGYNGTDFGILRLSGGTKNWTNQTNWNIDKMDGTGQSGITLNQQKGNVYQISYQWLGFGNIGFFIENPNNGKLTLVHQIQYPNQFDSPTILQPSLPIRVSSVNSNGNNKNITIKTASLAGFAEGNEGFLGKLFSALGSTATNTNPQNINVLTIKVNEQLNSINAYIPVILFNASFDTEANENKTVIISLILNGTFSSAPTYTPVDATQSVVSYSDTGVSVTNGTSLSTHLIRGNTGRNIEFPRDLQLFRNDTLSIIYSTLTNFQASAVANINWLEQDSG